MISILRQFIRKNIIVRKFFGYYLASSGFFDRLFINYKPSSSWHERIANVISSPDNKFINRVENAGRVINGKQIMHNGLKINLGSYYGPEIVRLLVENKGVHEPQEERVFAEVLKLMPENALMVELGAFWSFYSMWFNKEVKNATNYMIEGDTYNLGCGKRNFKLNGMKGQFIHANIGERNIKNANPPQICIDSFLEEKEIPFVDILHSDIQGFELNMLEGAKKTLFNNKIGFIFISTHSQELHEQCKSYLIQHQYAIIADVDLQQTDSEDGLLVGKSKVYPIQFQ